MTNSNAKNSSLKSKMIKLNHIMFVVLFVIGTLVYPKNITKAEDANTYFWQNCPYVCLPPEAYDDMSIPSKMATYSMMVLSCSAGVAWEELGNFVNVNFSGESSFGMPMHDSFARDAYTFKWPILATHLQKITDNKEKSRYLGLFSRMYYKVKKESHEETIKIVASQSQLNEVDVNQILNGSIQPLLRNGMTIADAYNEAERVKAQYKDEKTIIDISEDLQGEIEPTEIFSNGTVDDSGYDLIVDLNIIDNILFKNEEPLDTGLSYSKKNGSKLSMKIIDVDKEAEFQEQCATISDTKVTTQGIEGKNSKSQKIKSQTSSNDQIPNSKLQIQSNDTQNNNLDPATCSSGSSALDNAVNDYFEKNNNNKEVSETKKEFEQETKKQEEIANQTPEEKANQSTEKTVRVDGEEMTQEEYDALKKECEKAHSTPKPKDTPVENLNDELNKIGGDKLKNYFSCKENEKGEGKDKISAKFCIKLEFEKEPVTLYRKTDNCIACHVDLIINALDIASNLNFMSDKATGNLLEPNICKFSQPTPFLNINVATKPIITPPQTKLAERAQFDLAIESFKKSVKWGALKARISGNDKNAEGETLDPDELNELKGYNDMTLDEKASQIVFQSAPSDMTIDEATTRINDLIASEKENLRENMERYTKSLKVQNRSEFGNAIERELSDMFNSFQSMTQTLGGIVSNKDNACYKLKQVQDVK